MQAVILCGGDGKRLRPLTKTTPKSMLIINDKPFLEHQILLLRNNSIRNFVFCVGYKWKSIFNYFKDGVIWNINIVYSIENKPLGTGGSLKNAQKYLKYDFLVIYGDSFLPINYKKFYDKAIKLDRMAVLLIYDNKKDTHVKHNIAIDRRGLVVKYDKFNFDKSMKYVDAGVMLLKKKVLEFIPENRKVSLENHLFKKLIKLRELATIKTNQRFYDIGTFERLEEIKKILK